MKRTAMKRSQPKRIWSQAREKVDREAGCRLAGVQQRCAGKLEAAHIIGREHDKTNLPGEHMADMSFPDLFVEPVRIVPPCRLHHRMYDAHAVDLLPALTINEQLQAVVDAGNIEQARVRTCPSQYRKAAA